MTASTVRARSRRTVENPAYAAFVRRVLAAYGRRAADDIEALASLVALALEVDAAARLAVAGLRAHKHPYSWQDIAARLGVTRQAAHTRFGNQPDATDVGGPVPNAAYVQSLLDLLDGQEATA